MTGFSIDWLNLREDADCRARDNELLERAMHWLDCATDKAGDVSIVDLGAGTGSTLRAFDKFSAELKNQEFRYWHLVDQDGILLAEASLRHGASGRLQTHQLDLANISALPLAGARLVTASALFDLVSAEFIDRLATVLQNQSQQKPLGLYFALNYDGTTQWSPAHSLDDAVLSAFNRDQQRDKGFGEALGPMAASYMEQLFSSLGFSVLCASSPWVLDGGDAHLVDALITGIGDAVAQDFALNEVELEDWVRFRKSHAATGTCTVGHKDLLALPHKN